MKKALLLFWFTTLVCTLLHAQQQDELKLISSSHSRLNATTGNMMNYRPVYEHNGSTLSADSGYIYTDEEDRQYFDAFGKVIITQPNGTLVFADKLHYVAETQLATLINNVRMVDGNAVLTTNHLTYNMQRGLGQYTGGGRIVNTTDTITSRNATYFENTKDAYFRHDVIVRTPDVKIYTDTMRYNSDSKITYFMGPTNIKGNEGENLYTERGEYNTNTEQAWFDRNNLYTSGSRLLRGDSLYYDGLTGNGRAVDHVVFIDTADQFFAYGGIGLYHRVDESITMTVNPLVMTVTRNDSTSTDSTAGDDRAAIDRMVVDSLAADSVSGAELAADSLAQPAVERPAADTIYMTADTLFSQLIPLKDYIPMVFELDREGGALDDYEDEDFGEDFTGDFGESDSLQAQPSDSLGAQDTLMVPLDSARNAPPDTIHRDSLQRQPPDTLQAPPDTAKARPDSARQTATADTAVQAAATKAPLKRVAAAAIAGPDPQVLAHQLAADSVLREQAVIPTGGEADSLLLQAATALSRPPTDSIPKDSLANDTAKTRIVKAYYNMRLFKSDLQAVADSVYYGYPDSMMRFFGRPMIWAQGSQMTADTIYMQIRNEQLDNMLLLSNAFMVNTQLDSTKYNQIKGRKITGFFMDNALERMFIDGNAESIYYNVDEERKVYKDMYHSRSSRIKILVDSNRISTFVPISRVDGKVYPLHLVPQDAEILEGFVWKPGDRPTSKEDLLARRRPPAGSELAVPTDTTATPGQPPNGRPTTTDTTRTTIPPASDSTTVDSTALDTLRQEQPPVNRPAAPPAPASSRPRIRAPVEATAEQRSEPKRRKETVLLIPLSQRASGRGDWPIDKKMQL
ncbi:OstA-like protein [Parapedobacter sp. DT-150]|uniref:OstA-like protein n=1 Tax=Parapedobacter sp. DT-150 TaxID=3396162 RepID=UPI003F1CC43E